MTLDKYTTLNHKKTCRHCGFEKLITKEEYDKFFRSYGNWLMEKELYCPCGFYDSFRFSKL